MAVQYNKENGITTWLSAFKKEATDVCDEVKTLFKDVIPKKDGDWHDFFYDFDIDDFLKKHKIADENFKEFLSTVGNAKFDMQDYQKWLLDNGKATSTFANLTKKAGNILKSFGASIASMGVN